MPEIQSCEDLLKVLKMGALIYILQNTSVCYLSYADHNNSLKVDGLLAEMDALK